MEALKQYLNKLKLEQVENIYKKLTEYFQFLVETNQKFNLTAITDKTEAEHKHFIDSLSALDWVNGECLDIGAGAGFPSIPLAVIKQDCRFTLCDSVGKKVEFLEEVIKRLQLMNAEAIKSRAEDLKKEKQYDTVVMRGVGALAVICEYAFPFLKVGGCLIAYKAQRANEEISAAKNALLLLGGETERVIPYQLHYAEEAHERNLILVRKIKTTPPKYPRGQNKPRTKTL